MRNIQKVDRFVKQLESLPGDFSRLDEAIAVVESVLCNRPETFDCIIGSELRCLKLRPFFGVPPLVIYFRFDENTVYLMRAEPREDQE